MPRIVGVDIPGKKRLEVSLTYVFGIGRKLSKRIIEQLGLDPNMHAGSLSSNEVSTINKLLQGGKYVVEGELSRFIKNNIKNKIDIKSYQGIRHIKGLPVRGQRTQKNSRTRKGKGKTIANKKK